MPGGRYPCHEHEAGAGERQAAGHQRGGGQAGREVRGGAGLDPVASADLLLSVVIGLKVQGRVGSPREHLERAVDAALRSVVAGSG